MKNKNRSKDKHLFALYFMCIVGLVQGLIDDSVAQRTRILNYTSNTDLMFWHAYFDVSFDNGANLVQADETATY